MSVSCRLTVYGSELVHATWYRLATDMMNCNYNTLYDCSFFIGTVFLLSLESLDYLPSLRRQWVNWTVVLFLQLLNSVGYWTFLPTMHQFITNPTKSELTQSPHVSLNFVYLRACKSPLKTHVMCCNHDACMVIVFDTNAVLLM